MVDVYKTQLTEDNKCILVKARSIKYSSKKNFTSPNVAAQMMREVFEIHKQSEEYVYLLCLNPAMRLLGIFEISHGSVSKSIASPREIFQKALLCNASAIILVHNHTSGVIKASRQDIEITEQLNDAGKLMDIPLIDSIIVGREDVFSFMECGLLK